jgi:hypothetical protein
MSQSNIRLEFRIVVFLLAVLTISTTTMIRISFPSVSATITPSNQGSIGVTGGSGGNMTFIGNLTGGKSMPMPGGNMTFGASLQNTKMHLTEAILDLKTGNTKGAMMELSLTDKSLNMHEQEIKSMVMEVKR